MVPGLLMVTSDQEGTALRQVSAAILYLTVGIFAPLYLAAMLISPLEPGALSSAIHNLSLILLNGGGILTGTGLITIDLALRRATVGRDMECVLADGRGKVLLGELLSEAALKLPALDRLANPAPGEESRFNADPTMLRTGDALDAAHGINHFMRVADAQVHSRMGEGRRGDRGRGGGRRHGGGQGVPALRAP